MIIKLILVFLSLYMHGYIYFYIVSVSISLLMRVLMDTDKYTRIYVVIIYVRECKLVA